MASKHHNDQFISSWTITLSNNLYSSVKSNSSCKMNKFNVFENVENAAKQIVIDPLQIKMKEFCGD